MCFFPSVLPAQEWKTFNEPDILFTAEYPAGWVNKIKEGKRVFFTSPEESSQDDFRQNINISVTSNPQYGTTLKVKDIIQEIIDQVGGAFDNFKEESRKSLKWNGIDAFEITYTGDSKSGDKISVRITQRLCFYKTRLYLVTYTALKNDDAYLATAKQIINTIKFKP
jgi:hypothetical protein